MHTIREVRRIESDELVIHVPREFKNKRVEIIISPIDKEKDKKFSKGIANFLSLGNSNYWESDLDEMRASRDNIS